MSNIEIGNLYDLNKQFIAKNELALTHNQLEDAIELIKNYFSSIDNTYFMLLCREKCDYTVFKTNHTVSGNKHNATVLINEIISNRGVALSIEENEDKAIEIWIKDNNEAFAYYLFPCDACVIDEVG